MRVLIVEDEVRIAENVASGLRQAAGWTVDCKFDGAEGLVSALNGSYDLLVVDIMLPGLDGASFVERLRREGDRTPVMMLTACDQTKDKIAMLNSGADEYMTKPFDLGELVARAKALVRRCKGFAASIVYAGTLTMNLSDGTVRCKGELLDLSRTEFLILEKLMSRPKALVSKEMLLQHVYDFTWEQHSNVMEVHISNLRRKLRAAGDSESIHTARGRGYQLVAPQHLA